jgi:hypothetical protein
MRTRYTSRPSFNSVYIRIKNTLSCPGFIQDFRLSDTAFTRVRDLPFQRLVAFMLNLRKGSTEQELAGFFATVEEQLVASATPTRAAFSKARKQLSEKVFAALNRGAIATFRAGWKTPLWRGFRPFAVDGTTLRLPGGAALEAFFGAPGSGPTLARASVLYDIGHDLVVDAQVSATCVSERELAVEHLAAARPGDLLLYDRGYQAFWLFALHLMRGVEFCMRLPRGRFAAADAFWEGTEPSAIITLNPCACAWCGCAYAGARRRSWPPRSWRRRAYPHASSPHFITAAGAWRRATNARSVGWRSRTSRGARCWPCARISTPRSWP